MSISRIFAVASLSLALSSAPALAQSVNKRQVRQQHRIAQGIQNGTLTPRETAMLERQEARIDVLEAKDRRSGGGLSPKERAELNRLLNSESHRIYVQKHDGRGR
jgi:hypothetical protein